MGMSMAATVHMALNKQQGFSLLEAIVALVLVATTGMALLDWINTNLITLRRVSAVQQRQTAIRNALTFMELVNPLVDPKGQEKFDLFTIRWQAKPLELPKDGISSVGYMSLYQVSLYDTEVSVYADEQRLAQFKVRQVGFKQVRQPSNLFTE